MLHVFAYVLGPDYPLELSLMDQLGWLLASAAEYQSPLAFMQFFGDLFQGKKTGSVESSHVPQPQNHYGGQLVQVFCNDGNLVGRPKQERTVDAEDRRIVRNVFVLQNMDAPIFDIFVSDLRNGRSSGHAADEEQCSQNHS